MDKLIACTAKNMNKHQATFFVQESEERFALHFCTVSLNYENMYEHFWHCLEFNPDFVKILRKYGRLPIDNIVEQMQTVEEFKQHKEKVASSFCTRIAHVDDAIYQDFYTCKACLPEEGDGVCYACSIECHHHHEVKLVYKGKHRSTCDCVKVKDRSCRFNDPSFIKEKAAALIKIPK